MDQYKLETFPSWVDRLTVLRNETASEDEALFKLNEELETSYNNFVVQQKQKDDQYLEDTKKYEAIVAKQKA